MLTRGVALALVIASLLTCDGCGSTTMSPSSVPRNVTMAFNGLNVSGAPVAIYSESGFNVSANPGSWVALTTYGNPAPFIQFGTSAEDTGTGQIQVWADGNAAFSFKSVDLYSSVTKIPYTITGTRGAAVVFVLTDTLPNTLGAFRTVVNPHGTDVIDALTISLSDTVARNPMGVDNIVFSQ